VVVYSVKPKMSHSVTPFSSQNGHPYFKPECEKKILMDRDIVVLSTQTSTRAWYLRFQFEVRKYILVLSTMCIFIKRQTVKFEHSETYVWSHSKSYRNIYRPIYIYTRLHMKSRRNLSGNYC
jgi:hypothetical protein